MTDQNTKGHRERLRERFLAGEPQAHSDVAMLELLLCYTIPQRDVRPLAETLIARFGDLRGVLGAELTQLCAVDGVKASTATLIKLVARITNDAEDVMPSSDVADTLQQSLFDMIETPVSVESNGQSDTDPIPPSGPTTSTANRSNTPPNVIEHRSPGFADADTTGDESRDKRARDRAPRSEIPPFTNAVLKETLDLLPRIPASASCDEIGAFLRANLHFSAENTRRRFAGYIMQRMLRGDEQDVALLSFARRYAGRQELQDACLYRFCVAEPLMNTIADDLLLPAISTGRVLRGEIRRYLEYRFPQSKSIKNYLQAVVEVLVVSGVARPGREDLIISYREPLLPSFAFVLASEFPEPGLYSVEELVQRPRVRAMLWNPDRLLPALYELRNRGLIAKVSEIDRWQQFTTRYDLPNLVEALV